MEHLTRQQRRKKNREFNKRVMKEGKTILGQQLLDKDAKKRLEEYTPSNENPAIMPFCIVLEKEHDLNDYIHSCKAGAEAFLNNSQPKIIIFIREKGVELPAPKQELMKIGTRIFNKKAPDRTYIFIEAEGTQDTADISKPIYSFLKRIGEVPEGEPPPKWLSEYIYSEETSNEQIWKDE